MHIIPLRAAMAMTGVILRPSSQLLCWTKQRRSMASRQEWLKSERRARGQPDEVSRNYYAISKRTNSVSYFGEEVDMYKNGKVVSHEGAWLAGTGGARFGLMMPGLALLRAR